MVSKLKEYFPIIKEREELFQIIENDSHMKAIYQSWKLEQKEEFLDFCTGMKGMKILYDSFF